MDFDYYGSPVHYRTYMRRFLKGVWDIKIIQCNFRRLIAIKEVNIIRCKPEHLFDKEFGKKRMIMLNVSDCWNCRKIDLN